MLLTEEEALALLDIIFHSKVEDDALKASVTDKVTELCRDFLKTRNQELSSLPQPSDRSPLREVFEALVNLRSQPDSICA
jgi:hypothetical protein